MIRIFHAFKAASGHHILLVSVGGRALSFIGSWWVYRHLGAEALAPAIYAFQIIAFLIPFMGMGLYHGTLKYGAELKSNEEKKALYTLVLRRGRRWSGGLVGLLIALGSTTDLGFDGSGRYLIIFSFMLLLSFEYEMRKVLFRLLHRNGLYARLEGIHAALLLILIVILSTQWGVPGYALAFVVAPLGAVAYCSLAFPQLFHNAPSIRPSATLPPPPFFRYGIHTAFANVVSKLLFAADILLIGALLLRQEAVTQYKYLTLLPFSVLFLSAAYMTTHFVSLSTHSKDLRYNRRFIRDYIRLFSWISVSFLLVSAVMAVPILRLFGSDLIPFSNVFLVLALGATGILLLRGLFGNLLSACGRADLAFYAGAIGLAVNIGANWVLIPRYGLMGAAITSAGTMWLTGILSGGFYYISCMK